MSKWKPIETAPKDGTPVLVRFRGRVYVAEYTSVWHPDNLKWCVRNPPTGAEDATSTVVEIDRPVFADGTPVPGGHPGPTHWMPVPA